MDSLYRGGALQYGSVPTEVDRSGLCTYRGPGVTELPSEGDNGSGGYVNGGHMGDCAGCCDARFHFNENRRGFGDGRSGRTELYGSKPGKEFSTNEDAWITASCFWRNGRCKGSCKLPGPRGT